MKSLRTAADGVRFKRLSATSASSHLGIGVSESPIDQTRREIGVFVSQPGCRVHLGKGTSFVGNAL